MPTTFNVIFLGNLADIDTIEGNTTTENAAALVGLTFGGPGNALVNSFQTLSPGSVGFASDGNTYYDMDDPTPETFRINGGPDQGFDGTAVYNATLTYLDGTTAAVTAVVFQDTNGNAYLAPEFTANADQTALEAGPILSLSLDSLPSNSFLGMTGDRQAFNFVPCFTTGVRIATPAGPQPVEGLAIGDPVVSRDNGAVPIRWIGKATRKATGNLVPIRIAAGALGKGLPERDLVVSPQHRMLVRSRIAARMFGGSDVLVPAKKLLGLPGIELATDIEEVTYIHLLFDRHEIIYAEGAPTESLLLGTQALLALGREARAELRALFGPGALTSPPQPARPIPAGRLLKRLVERHTRNRQPLLQV